MGELEAENSRHRSADEPFNWEISVNENGVTIADTAVNNFAHEQPNNLHESIRAKTANKGERSLGLSIVKRLFERYG